MQLAEATRCASNEPIEHKEKEAIPNLTHDDISSTLVTPSITPSTPDADDSNDTTSPHSGDKKKTKSPCSPSKRKGKRDSKEDDKETENQWLAIAQVKKVDITFSNTIRLLKYASFDKVKIEKEEAFKQAIYFDMKSAIKMKVPFDDQSTGELPQSYTLPDKITLVDPMDCSDDVVDVVYFRSARQLNKRKERTKEEDVTADGEEDAQKPSKRRRQGQKATNQQKESSGDSKATSDANSNASDAKKSEEFDNSPETYYQRSILRLPEWILSEVLWYILTLQTPIQVSET